MFDFYKKRKFKKTIYSKTFLVFMLIPVFFMSFAAFNAYKKEKSVKVEESKLSANLASLETRKNKLENDLEKLNTKRGIEEELRERFELGKEGEQSIVFVEEEKEKKQEKKVEEKKSFWERVFDF